MKILFRTIMFSSATLMFYACGSNKAQWTDAKEYQKFYNSINKEYDDAVSFTQAGVDRENREQAAKKKKKDIAVKKDSFYLYVGEMSKDIKELKVLAQQNLQMRDELEGLKADLQGAKTELSSLAKVTTVPSTHVEPKAEAKVVPQPQTATPVFPASTGTENKGGDLFRTGKYTLVDEADAHLVKKYNVVIASLTQKAGVVRLQKTLKASNPSEAIFVLRTNNGMYYVIKGSSDDPNEAMALRNVTIDNFTKRYTKSELMKKYGIPFTDLWIISNEN